MMYNTAMSSATTEKRALEIDGPQPVWKTLDEARERAFTGEIVLELEPEVFVYVDNGAVYHAECADDAPLGRRLAEAGVLDEAQLARGTVRVGGIDHLGRLFDRDPSIDRDAVLVAAELLTQELVTELANREIATVRVTAYRHHPAGVHHWFAEPPDALAPGSITDTGRLSAIPAGMGDELSDELRIEWDEPIGAWRDEPGSLFTGFDAGDPEASGGFESLAGAPPVEGLDLDPEPAADVRSDRTLDDGIDIDLLLDLGDDTDDVSTGAPVAEDLDALTVPGDEFQLMWPDGSAAAVAPNDTIDDAEEAPAAVQEDETGFRFEMPPLTFDVPADADDDAAADAPVSDDVADAVRRALAAIEAATAESASVAPMDDAIGAEPVPPAAPFAEPVDDAWATAPRAEAPVPETVVDDTPLTELPVAETPLAETPVAETPLADSPAPAGDLPFAQPPADESPAPAGDPLPVAQPPAREPVAEVPPSVLPALEDQPMEAPAAGPAPTPASPFAPPTPDMAAEAIYEREVAEAQARLDASAGPAVASTDPGRAATSPATDQGAAAADDDGEGDRRSALQRLIGSLRRKDH